MLRRFLDDPAWRRQAVASALALGIALFAVRVLGGAWTTQYQIFFPDSFSFKNAARETPFSLQFYADERPVMYPTLLFLLGRSTVVTVVVQTLIYASVFALLVGTGWRQLRNAEARVVAAVFIVLLGTQSRFALWNTHILSESLGISLGVLSVAMWWRFSSAPGLATLRHAALCTIAWTLVRDSNIPPWLAVGVPALLVGARLCRAWDPRLRRAMVRWAAITLVVGTIAALGQAANGRNRYATMNNVGQRVLVSEELTEWFVDQGMPISPALRERTGFSSFDNDWKMLNSPALTVFRKWADQVGQRQMLMSYVRFAPYWASKLHDDLPVLLASEQSAYDAFGVRQRLPGMLPLQLGGPTSRSGLWAWLALAAAGLLVALNRRRPQSIVLGLLLLSSVVDFYIAYVGDSVEVQRHMVGPISRLTAILFICVAVGLDCLIDQVRSSGGSRDQRPESAEPDVTHAAMADAGMVAAEVADA